MRSLPQLSNRLNLRATATTILYLKYQALYHCTKHMHGCTGHVRARTFRTMAGRIDELLTQATCSPAPSQAQTCRLLQNIGGIQARSRLCVEHASVHAQPAVLAPAPSSHLEAQLLCLPSHCTKATCSTSSLLHRNTLLPACTYRLTHCLPSTNATQVLAEAEEC